MKRRFLVDQLVQNPGNPLEQLQAVRDRIDRLERLLVDQEASDARYSRVEQSAFHVHKNGADQTGVTHNTWTKVTWSTRLFDRLTQFNLSNNSFAVPQAGLYQFGATIKWTAFSDGIPTRLALYKNGAAAWYGPQVLSGAATPVGCGVNALVTLAAGDVIEVYAWHGTVFDVDRTIEGDATDSYFWGTWVQ